MKRARPSICASLFFLCGTVVIHAQPVPKAAASVPRLVTLSGSLVDRGGRPLSGVMGVTFALYEEERGGAPLWMETQNVQADATGRYTAVLGSTRNEGIPAEVFASGQGRWLGVQVQEEAERPRVLMVSVPYALKAVDAETLGGLPASAFALAGTPAAHAPGRGGSAAATPNALEAAPGVTPALTGTGTANRLAYWTSSTNIASSVLYQAPSKRIGLGTTAPTTLLEVDSPSGSAILGKANGTSGSLVGVSGQSASAGGNGVFGTNTATSGGIGVLGTVAATSGFAVGVEGTSTSPNGNGVFGQNLATTGSAQGVVGFSSSTNGNGVSGNALATSGNTNGVLGIAASSGGNGVLGVNNATSGGNGVSGNTNATANGNGVIGVAACTTCNGVLGINNATSGFAVGVNGQTSSAGAPAINGTNFATTGGSGGNFFSNATSGYATGVYGQSASTNGVGVSGNATATSGNTNGVFGSAASPNGAGVYGTNTATSGFAVGVNGLTASVGGVGVNGVNTATTGGNGVQGASLATSGFGVGVSGSTNSPGGAGVFGWNTAASGGLGVQGQSGSGGVAVFGVNQTCNGSGCTLMPGVGGQFLTGTGGTLLQGYGGSFSNRVFYVDAGGNGFFSGNLNVTGTVTKGGGSFKIDHPLDPENKYLSHSFVESPDMMDVYNGVVRLDAKGQAWVNLPEYFEALNGDFRYQLTAIGAPAPRLHIAREVSQNRFKIAGGRPGGRVSWQVTGIRHDPYANAHRIPVTEDKPAAEQGRYLHPDAYGRNDSAEAGPASH